MMISFLYRREPVSERSGLSSVIEQMAAFVRLQSGAPLNCDKKGLAIQKNRWYDMTRTARWLPAVLYIIS